jgi:protein tyrosine/serine phosphatase
MLQHRVRLPRIILPVLFLVSPVAAQTIGPPPPDARAARIGPAAVRIDNFGQVNERYYRGAQPKERDYADLAALGVKTVVDLTGPDTLPAARSLAASAGLGYLNIPMTTHQPPTSAQMAEFLGVATDPARLPVYVHCAGGRHRTGVMTAVYRMMLDGWSPDQAFREMKRYKFGADFLHPEFKRFVLGFTPAAFRPAFAALSGALPR